MVKGENKIAQIVAESRFSMLKPLSFSLGDGCSALDCAEVAHHSARCYEGKARLPRNIREKDLGQPPLVSIHKREGYAPIAVVECGGVALDKGVEIDRIYNE